MPANVTGYGCIIDPSPRVADAVQQLTGVFLEILGTRLTLADASRLGGLDCAICQLVPTALEDARFLKRGRDGIYLQLTIDSPDT